MGFFEVYRRTLVELRAERVLAIGLTLANVAVAALQFYEPVLFGAAVDVLASADGNTAHALWHDLRGVLLLWLIVGAGGLLANILVSLQADRMAHRRRLAAIVEFMECALTLPIAFHNDRTSAHLVKVMLAGADSLFGLCLSFFRESAGTLVALFVLLPLSLLLNWRLGLLLLALSVFFAATTVWVIGRTDQLQRRVEGFHTQLATRVGDAFGNVRLIQSFVRLGEEASEMQKIMRQTLAAQFPVLNWWALLSVMARTASTMSVIMIFILGTWLYTCGQATIGEIVAFMGFAAMLVGRMNQVSGFICGVFGQMPVFADFFQVIAAETRVVDRPDGIEVRRARGDVAFDDVSFSYDGKRPALANFSLKVEAGMTVALVGSSGAGKSTALSLLHRAWDPQQGTIRVDGIDHRDIRLESLRRNIGVVFQDNTLFHRTIAENLRIGKIDATQDELEAAARLAEAHDFIVRQPHGYETMVGERGVTLSGGERQRLAIARAVLKDPPILILDEATSALDAVTEARLQKALKLLTRGRTTFVIAHRLSTMRDADLIVVLEHGRIIETGDYAGLLARQGTFAHLVETQQLGMEGPEAGRSLRQANETA